jgi:hypothetical protein
MKPCAGDWVEVRSKNEILATLDKSGRLEGLPFMPQMFQFCGQKLQVYKRAHKACDTVSGHYTNRGIPHGVHLGLRCDGKAFDGCQAACLILWNEAWLKPVEGQSASGVGRTDADPRDCELPADAKCTVDDVIAGTRAAKQHPGNETRYICQATELLNYSIPLKTWDARQYLEDYRSGNASVREVASVLLFAGFQKFARAKQLGRPARRLYDWFQSLRGGTPYPRKPGSRPLGEASPDCNLSLQPGDLVRVKSLDQILSTVNSQNMHRGMSFDAEMVPYCGRIFRVRDRVERFLDERTGLMRRLKTPAVILEGVVCAGHYSNARWLCPRSIFAWWREVWLERIPGSQATSNSESTRAA